MDLDLIRYYFYLEEDGQALTAFRSCLAEKNIIPHSFSSENLAQLKSHSSYFMIKSGRTEILVVRLLDSEKTARQNEELLGSLERTCSVTPEILLGKVTVWAAAGQNYSELKNSAGLDRPEVLQLKMPGGILSRFSLFWPQGHAQYLCSLSDPGPLDELFLYNGLPQLEAEMLELHLILNLYKDRQRAIDKQTGELDKKLGAILHTDLVARSSQLKLVDELESQITELARSYGITAGNKNVIMEGISHIQLRLNGLLRNIKNEKALGANQEETEIIVDVFRKPLNSMLDVSAKLDLSLKNHQAAINVIESRINLLNSRHNIAAQEKIRDLLELNSTMQKQSLIFQISAAAIEFIVIAYYSHSLWRSMSKDAYYLVPGWVQLIFALLFSANVVYCTHLVGEYIQDKKNKQVKKHLLISLIPLFILLLLIIGGSILLGAPLLSGFICALSH